MAERVIDLVGPHGYIHGWIKPGSGAHDDLERGMAPHHAAAVKSAMDKAHDASMAGNHRLAAAHLENAMNQARYAKGSTGRLQSTIRQARDAQLGMASTGPSIAEAQQYAGYLPSGIRPGNATKAQIAAAVRKGKRATSTSYSNECGDAVSLTWNGIEGIDLAMFTESLHPRVPAGGPGGGEFGSKSATAASKPAKGAKGKTAPKGKPKPSPDKPGGQQRAEAEKQVHALRSKATADRAKAAAIEARIGALRKQIETQRKASATASAASTSAKATTAAAAAAGKAATTATTKTTAGKSTVKKTAGIPKLRARVSSLRGQVKSLRASADALDKQAKAIPLAGDSAALELAFREMFAERVPPGRPTGGQFAPKPARLTRHDTPDQRAAVINSLNERQRAGCRASLLPPPGFLWSAHDRLAEAT